MECELVEVSNMSANSSPHVTSVRMAVMKVVEAMMVTLLVNGGGRDHGGGSHSGGGNELSFMSW